MGLQFYNINTRVYEKPASRVCDIIKSTTTLKKRYKKKFKYSKVGGGLTAENLAFLQSLNAI